MPKVSPKATKRPAGRAGEGVYDGFCASTRGALAAISSRRTSMARGETHRRRWTELGSPGGESVHPGLCKRENDIDRR